MYKIGIIDHVGHKSGMDIYDMSLSTKLCKNAEVHLLSNFETNSNLISQLKVRKIFNTADEGKSAISKAKYFFKGFWKAFKYLNKNKCKTIILHSFSFEYKDLIICLLAKAWNFKTLLIVHDVSGFAKNDSTFVKRIILNRLTTKILVHNKFSKDAIIGEVEDTKKIITVRHGGYTDYVNSSITKLEAYAELKLDPGFRYILFFGQIKEVKGLDLLIEAFGKLTSEKVKLIIAGKPWKDDFSKYEKLINDYNLNKLVVLFKRFIPDSEKDLLFAASDVVVIPYKKIFQSGVLLTALSYPCVVLCSDLEPNMEVIKSGENGFLFETNNIDSLASMLTSILNENSEKIKQIKDNALKTVKTDYSWDYAAEIIIKNLTND